MRCSWLLNCQPLLRIWPVSFYFCLLLSLYSSRSSWASFNLLKTFFLSLPSMSFVSSVPTICWLILTVLKHSSCSKKQLWLTSPRAAKFCLWLFTFPYISFPFHFISLMGNLIPFFSALTWLPSFIQYFATVFILCCFSVSLLSYWQSNRRVLK